MKISRIANFIIAGALMFVGSSTVAYAAVCSPDMFMSVWYGQSGGAVSNIQQCLIDAGYSIPAGATGYYGGQTRTAVKTFYSAVLGMVWDGNSVGPVGRTKLAAKIASGTSGGTIPSTGSVSFKRVTTQAEFQKYVQAETDQNNYSNALWGLSKGTATGGVVPSIAPSTPLTSQNAVTDSAGSSAEIPERYSNTTVQVAGIDEPDIVKTDGTAIYVSKQGWGGIIRPLVTPIAEGASPDAMPIYYEPKQQTYVVSAFPLSSLGIASKAITEQGDMLLVKDKKILVIFSQPNIVAYDVSDPKKPVKKWTFALGENTGIVTSRLKDGTVYLVTSTWLNSRSPCPIMPMLKSGIGMPIPCTDIWVPSTIEPTNTLYTVFAIDPTTGTTTNKLTLAGDSNNAVISMFENNLYLTYRSQTAMTGVLIDFYSTQLGDFLPAATIARINTIKSYDISSGSKLNEVQIAINTATAGMNSDARLKFDNEVQNRLSSYLDIHARELDRSVVVRVPLSTLTIAATGMIPGHLLNQFSLDEYQGNLRAAVTVGDQWGIGGGRTKNDVYVLGQNLTTLGSVTDLGFQGERVYAARFIGPRGYLVTFRQTDPFYVLDLSNPVAPKMAGQLKIPGYSAYLEPLSDTLILGVGREGSQVKLSIFDVSDPNNPVEKSKYTLAENWTEVENNHHAFLRDPDHQVFFLPGSQGGYVFSYASGTLNLRATHSDYSINRAVYIDDYLYMIGSDTIAVFNEVTWKKEKDLILE